MTEDPDKHLSDLIRRIQECRDEHAVTELWRFVFDRVIGMARSRIANLQKRVSDHEDVALSAIKSFVRAAESGRLRNTSSGEDLWRILATITLRKSRALAEWEQAEKRGAGQVRGDSVFRDIDSGNGFDQVIDPAHPDRFVDELMGECRERIESLPDETLRTIALRRMEGFEVNEIAQELGIATATIKRKLARIRVLWAESDGARQ